MVASSFTCSVFLIIVLHILVIYFGYLEPSYVYNFNTYFIIISFSILVSLFFVKNFLFEEFWDFKLAPSLIIHRKRNFLSRFEEEIPFRSVVQIVVNHYPKEKSLLIEMKNNRSRQSLFHSSRIKVRLQIPDHDELRQIAEFLHRAMPDKVIETSKERPITTLLTVLAGILLVIEILAHIIEAIAHIFGGFG